MRCAKKLDINSVGCFSEEEVELGTVRDDTFLELTIDSGAGENVMSEHMAPRAQVQVSRGQQAGVMCTAANGEIMPNRGVITREGQTKTMNVQAMRATPSFSSLREGSEETKFRRENNVYRMTVKLYEEGWFCEAGLRWDGGQESEVLRKLVRPRELEVAGFEDEDFGEIACEE